MRRPFIAGNWKMNLDRAEAVALASGVAKAAEDCSEMDLAVCPPSVYLDAVATAVAGSNVAVGAQNLYHEPKGAFTGEISTAMLHDIGCRYVILGHSERRELMGEGDTLVAQKAAAAHEGDLRPIICLGEPLPTRIAGNTLERIDHQIVRTFRSAEITAAGIDLDKEGLRGPSSTWTYLINDNPFGDVLQRLFRGLVRKVVKDSAPD